MGTKFKQGDKVVLTSEVRWREDELPTMTVIDLTVNGDVVVEIEGWRQSKTKEVFAYYLLMLESDAQKKISDLDKEFDKLSPLISKKIEKAAASFNEAMKLVNNSGFKLSDFSDARDYISDCIREGGWSSSSFSC